MNVQNAAIDTRWKPTALTRKNGPRNNTSLAAKNELRHRLLAEIEMPKVYEVFGSGGEATKFYQRNGVEIINGCGDSDAIQALKVIPPQFYNLFDIDPYSNPFEPLKIIAELNLLSDGCLRTQCKFRGNLPSILQKLMSWDNKNKHLKAWIYYHYPEALRSVIDKIFCPRFSVERMWVCLGRKSSFAQYAAFILQASKPANSL